MRFGIILWSFVCSWCIFQAVSFYSTNLDYSIIFGWGFMISLYLFISKTVAYIKEDYPMKINVSVNDKKTQKE